MKNPPFDILNQAGYLLVFVLSSWLNHAPQLRWPAMLFGDRWIPAALAFGAIWFLLDAVLWRDRPYSLRAMKCFLLGWNAVALGSMGWMWSNAPLVR